MFIPGRAGLELRRTLMANFFVRWQAALALTAEKSFIEVNTVKTASADNRWTLKPAAAAKTERWEEYLQKGEHFR